MNNPKIILDEIDVVDKDADHLGREICDLCMRLDTDHEVVNLVKVRVDCAAESVQNVVRVINDALKSKGVDNIVVVPVGGPVKDISVDYLLTKMCNM